MDNKKINRRVTITKELGNPELGLSDIIGMVNTVYPTATMVMDTTQYGRERVCVTVDDSHTIVDVRILEEVNEKQRDICKTEMALNICSQFARMKMAKWVKG